MSLSSWLDHFSDTCPDEGLQSYTTLSEGSQRLPRTIIWIGVLWAFEQSLRAVLVAFQLPRPSLRFVMRFRPTFALPTALVLLWVFFTALSIIMVGLTFRSSAALLVKTFHVATETTFLVTLLVAFRFDVFAAAAIVFVTAVMSMVFTLPCEEMVGYASTGGLILDSINFLALSWYGLSRPDDSTLWTLIGGFGWHSLYLLTYLVIKKWKVSAIGLVWFRIAGMIFNIVASEFLLRAVALSQPDRRTGWMDTRTWLAADEAPAVLWCNGRAWLRRKSAANTDADVVPTHAADRTAYATKDVYRAWHVFLLTGGVLTTAGTQVTRSVLCSPIGGTASIDDAERAPCTRVFVVPTAWVRIVWWTILAATGVVLGAFP
jgi:hypothetical protein